MLKDDERFDQLIRENIKIIQSKSVFSFSLDAVLLADFANVPHTKPACIIDACSGNGVVAFLLSHKTRNKVYAIEYQERLVDMAKRTVEVNALSDKVEVIHGDYTQATRWFKKDSVDVITCNPPYFKVDNQSLKNDNQAYALARHELTITLEQWVKQSADLLKMGGKLYCVHRPERLMSILDTMKRYDLAPKKIQFVHPKQGKPANMVLIEAIKHGKDDGVVVLPSIVVFDESGQYLEPVKSILYGN